MDQSIKRVSIGKWLKGNSGHLVSYGGLIFCIILFTVLPPIFGQSMWSSAKLGTLVSDVIVTALMAVGAVFVYALGNLDISIGSQMRVYATLMVIMGNLTGSLLYGILISLVISVVIAIINGAAGQVLKIHPVVSSLVFMMALSGVSSMIYVTMGSRNIRLDAKLVDFTIFKETWFMVLVLVVEIFIVSYLFYFTKFGKNARAIGANPLAAEQSGISLLKYKIVCYVIMGLCVVVASLFQMGYTGSASDSTGTGFEMNVMVALILGGMPLSGGMKTRVSAAVVGSLIFSILKVGLPLIGVPNNFTFLIKALIFIVVVLLTCRKKEGSLPR